MMANRHIQTNGKVNDDFIEEKIKSLSRNNDEAFFIVDLSDVVRKYTTWKRELPRVEPFYAVKCNEDVQVLSLLAQLGTGFDCASKAEIDKILSLNVAPNRVIYANPCKQSSHIRHAAKHEVNVMTFDNIDELSKIEANHSNAKLVVRIMPPSTEIEARCPLGDKFGALLEDVPELLKAAKSLGLTVIGVSFHVGSGCNDPAAYPKAVAEASTAFDMGLQAGFHFDLLDIGGGFPGQKSAKVSFEEFCGPLRSALDEYFPESKGVHIIAEPGRYFVESAFTLAVSIIGKRTVLPLKQKSGDGKDDDPKFMYYLNDGIFGSFNCIVFAAYDPVVELEDAEQYTGKQRFLSSIWGPTCDAFDILKREICLPELNIGDWLIYREMGAYTTCAATSFNGMQKTRAFYVMQKIDGISCNAGIDVNVANARWPM